MRNRKRNWDATEAAMRNIREIEKALEEIKVATEGTRSRLSDGFCDWGDVGDLACTNDALTALADRLYKRGEYSDEANRS
jgi:hypothetical protein